MVILETLNRIHLYRTILKITTHLHHLFSVSEHTDINFNGNSLVEHYAQRRRLLGINAYFCVKNAQGEAKKQNENKVIMR
jgi:hypothetical protein